ncbi:MAG: Unknown protein [uncultured Sulfurovum sp.]|uniref:Uncharacterized protein n=1 Tax=uncultured Sulfurovum sp. TaxID=269237 RepID=A0A6S6TII8_9BACT|nr:MAG: Unknown protein [uncultured Sulfurovum sp.]
MIQKNILSHLLLGYFQLLERHSIAYCVIGNYEKLPEYTSNDVDFWVSDKEKAEKLLLSLAKELTIKLYMQNKTANGTNNYFYYKHEEGNCQIIKIDLMTETAYKSLVPLVSSTLIQNNRKKYKNFYVVNEEIEAIMHLFYPLVTFGIVKNKYREKLQKIIKNQTFKTEVIGLMGTAYGDELIDYIRVGEWEKIEKDFKKIRGKFIVRMLKNLNVKRLGIFMIFLKTIFTRIKNKNGLSISFTGIDGAGKTSIKKYFVENSSLFFTSGRVKEFYWRPFLLPRVSKMIGSQGQKEILDTSGRRVIEKSIKNSVKNYIKYFYYILDFVFGKLKYFVVTHTGGLVVFDRYHFDNIIYPERFGFKVNKVFMRFVDKWIIPQPDLLFYLTANTETLYERKYEIDIDEINKQKEIYKDEIEKRGKIITVQTDGDFKTSVSDILEQCLFYMSQRIKDNG